MNADCPAPEVHCNGCIMHGRYVECHDNLHFRPSQWLDAQLDEAVAFNHNRMPLTATWLCLKSAAIALFQHGLSVRLTQVHCGSPLNLPGLEWYSLCRPEPEPGLMSNIALVCCTVVTYSIDGTFRCLCKWCAERSPFTSCGIIMHGGDLPAQHHQAGCIVQAVWHSCAARQCALLSLLHPDCCQHVTRHVLAVLVRLQQAAPPTVDDTLHCCASKRTCLQKHRLLSGMEWPLLLSGTGSFAMSKGLHDIIAWFNHVEDLSQMPACMPTVASWRKRGRGPCAGQSLAPPPHHLCRSSPEW